MPPPMSVRCPSVEELVRHDADVTAYAGISGAIREIVQTGTLAKLEKLRAAGFALACGEYLSDAATSAIIVTPAPIHTVAGKRRLECGGLTSASRSVFTSSPETVYFFSLIIVNVICTIKGPKNI